MSRVGDLSTRIFVGGLNNDVTETDLENAFKLFGTITNVMVMRDKENGRSRGFAFVSFKDQGASEEAINRMHGVEICGRCVSVRHAEKEKYVSDDRPKRGGFRGRGIGSHIGNRQDNFRGSFRGNGYRGRGGFFKPSDRVFVTDDREDYHEPGLTSHIRSRSPPTESQMYRRVESPPRSRRFSPDPPQRQDAYYPPSYGQMPVTRYEDGYYGQRPSSPPPKEIYEYGNSQTMSPTRELNAYIQARGLKHSPLSGARKLPDMTRQRSTSPGREQYHREPIKQVNYGISSSSLKHASDPRLGKRSQDTRIKTGRDRSPSPVAEKYQKIGSYEDHRAPKQDDKHSFRGRQHSPQDKRQERPPSNQRGSQNRGTDRHQSPFSRGRSPGDSYARSSPTASHPMSRSGYEKQSFEHRRTKSPGNNGRSPPSRYRSPERQNSSFRKSPANNRSFSKQRSSPSAERRSDMRYRSPQRRTPPMSRYKPRKQASPPRRSPDRFDSSQRHGSSSGVRRKTPPRYQSPDRQRSSPGRQRSFQTRRSPPASNQNRQSTRYSHPERKSPQPTRFAKERMPQRRSPDNRTKYQGRNMNSNRGRGNTHHREHFDNKRSSFNSRKPERDERRDFGRQSERSPPVRRRSPIGGAKRY